MGYTCIWDEFSVIVNFNTIAEFNCQEDRMFYFVSDVRSSDVVVKTLRVIFYYDFALAFALILSLYELLFQIIIGERLHKRTKLFLLIISS